MLEHRNKIPTNDILNASDVTYFNQKLSLLFAKDFSSQPLADYFFNFCGVIELETEQIMKIKDNNGVISQIDFKERLRLAIFEHEQSNQVIAIRVLPDQKEPWE